MEYAGKNKSTVVAGAETAGLKNAEGNLWWCCGEIGLVRNVAPTTSLVEQLATNVEKIKTNPHILGNNSHYLYHQPYY